MEDFKLDQKVKVIIMHKEKHTSTKDLNQTMYKQKASLVELQKKS